MKIIIAKNFYLKFIGLMFKHNINYGIYFPKVNMIHTFFMRENINVIGLDKNNRVNDIRCNVKPWKIVILSNSVNTLEVPTYINYKIGDYIKISY